jgi:hypothetical protein
MEPGTIRPPFDEIEARLSPDHRALYFGSDRTTPVNYPRNRETAHRDLLRIQEWKSGSMNIWTVDISPWLIEALTE